MSDLFTLMLNRMGLDYAALESINDATHPPLLDIDKLCDRLHELYLSGEKLVLFPDIDMDGVTSGTLGYAGFCQLGFNISLFIPEISGGHGFKPHHVEAILASNPDAKGIITTDTGIDSFAGVEAAQKHGLKVFITDHHKEIERVDKVTGLVSTNTADVIVNPMRLAETYPHPAICGAHVIWQVLMHYAKTYAPEKQADMASLVLFAGMGTVADVMPVLYENRAVVRDSISTLRLLYVPAKFDEDGDIIRPWADESTFIQLLQGHEYHPVYTQVFTNVAEILASYVMEGKLRSINEVDESFYGFYLSPIFNSIRRLESSLTEGFAIFLDPAPQAHIDYLFKLNELRKEMVTSYIKILNTSIQPFAPYVYLSEAPSGMLGLLANKIMHDEGTPTIVARTYDDGSISGSARSPQWYPFNTKLNKLGAHAAGHEAAFGVSFENSDQLSRILAILDKDVKTTIENLIEEGGSLYEQTPLTLGEDPNTCDAGLADGEELWNLTKQIEALKPFGHEFPEPQISIRVKAAQLNIRLIGKDKQHISITTSDGFKCLWWNSQNHSEDLENWENEYITIVGTLATNTFNGIDSVNLIVEHIEGL